MSGYFYYVDKQLAKLHEEQRKHLQEQVDTTDWSVLKELEHRETVTERGTFAPLDAVEVEETKRRQKEFQKIGLEALRAGEVGLVLLAGGQGTRLGFDRPKGTVDIGETRPLYIFECLMNNLKVVADEAGVMIPLYIMTSVGNQQETKEFFEENHYFGYDSSFIRFFTQQMAPAVDYEGRVLMKSQTELCMSPNGNGGWFSSMVQAGLLEEIHERGIEWLNVFAVDNVLQRMADPLFIGAVLSSGCESGAKVVRKVAADEKVGVLCTEDGKPSIVEYYEMTQDMASARKENGDLQYGFGVILNYLFREDRLEAIADEHMPVHVVEKKIPYMDENGNPVKPQETNGYKFETLVLDMVHMMADCLPYEVEREKEFAPIKNLHGVDSIDSARELLRRNGVQL